MLRSVEEYDLAAGEVRELLDRHPKPGSDDYDRLELLTVLIQAYDAEYVRFGEDADITPQQIVEFVLEQNGKTRTDLAPRFGGRSRVSEFFSGKRQLSMGQLIALREAFSIPVELLIPRQPMAATSNPARKAAAAKTKRKVQKKAAQKKQADILVSSRSVGRPRKVAKVARKK